MAMNPYLQDQANAITNQVNNNLQTQILPGINQGSIAAGGFGGSRQGIAQGLAIGQTNLGLSSALSNLYGNAYENDQNRSNQAAMQAAQLAANEKIAARNDLTQRDLGFGQLGLGNKQADNAYNLGLMGANTNQYGAETNRALGYGGLGLQANQQNFNNALAGYNAQLNGLNSLMNWNAQGVNLANQQQQWPLQYLTGLANLGTSIGGMGGTQTTPYYGNPILGAIGGAQLGGNVFGNLFGKSGG